MVKKISVSTHKGGVLKTSITTSLGGMLANSGYRVLIVDTDSQGNVALTFAQSPDEYPMTLFDALVNGKNPMDCIFNLDKNLDIMPSNDDMELFDFDVLTNLDKYKNPFYLMKDSLKYIENQYDFIFVDTPPSLGLIQGNVVSYVDDVLIPFQPETYSMRSLVKVLNFINKFKDTHNNNLSVLGVVATLVDSRTNLHQDILKEAEGYCDNNQVKLFNTVIPRTIKYSSSVTYEGLPVTLSGEKDSEMLKQVYYNLLGEVANAYEQKA